MSRRLQNIIGAFTLLAIIVSVVALAWWAIYDSVFPPTPEESEAQLTEERKDQFLKALEKGNLELHPAEHWKPLEVEGGD